MPSEPDTTQVGSTPPPSPARRSPTWSFAVILAFAAVSVAAILLLGPRLIEADHYAFLRAVHLGQTRQEIEQRFGKPVHTWTPEQQQELVLYLGPDESYHPDSYYHRYQVIEGQRPTEYKSLSVWHTGVARGEFVYFGEHDRAICILSGSS